MATSSQRKPTGWLKATGYAAIAVGVLAVLVIVARLLLGMPSVQGFVERYPGTGTAPEAAPIGVPVWLSWQHFFNMFLMVMIVRTGWLVRTTQRPRAYWTRNNKKFIRTKGAPTKISFNLWLHLSFDVLWLLNGLIFVVLLFSTGRWMRVVPTHWDFVPNAISVGLQYLSLNWPTEDSWVHYNALQVITYFVTIFIAAPLAAITGFRMSPAFSKRWVRLGKMLPMAITRTIHLCTLVYFVVFIIVHVTLVMATGALRNLNHMYAATDDPGWTGFWYFAASLVVVVVGWVLARPIFMQPVASVTGKVTAR